MLQRRLEGHRYRERFIDLTGIFDGGERERYFTDTVHVTDSGQPLIAEALVTPDRAVPRLRRCPGAVPRSLRRTASAAVPRQ